MISIRPAAQADLAAINDIYNHYVLSCTCTWQTVPETMESRRQWFAHHGAKHPVIVAEDQGVVVGWGSLSKFHPREAWGMTVEDSVYIHHQRQGQGLGSLLLKRLIELAAELGHHTIVAAISGDQAGSIALHRKFDFTDCGCIRQAGFKFDRWLDVIYMQRMA